MSNAFHQRQVVGGIAVEKARLEVRQLQSLRREPLLNDISIPLDISNDPNRRLPRTWAAGGAPVPHDNLPILEQAA
jgi:hypothetical protein